MIKEAIDIILGVIIIFAGIFWILLFLYFAMQGITPTLGRMAISTIIFTIAAFYFVKKRCNLCNTTRNHNCNRK